MLFSTDETSAEAQRITSIVIISCPSVKLIIPFDIADITPVFSIPPTITKSAMKKSIVDHSTSSITCSAFFPLSSIIIVAAESAITAG